VAASVLALGPWQDRRRRLAVRMHGHLGDVEESKDYTALERVFHKAVASHGSGEAMTKEAFIDVCRNVLHLDLTPKELARIFDHVLLDEGTWGLDFDSFAQTVRQRFFLRGIRRVMRVHTPGKVKLPPWYDLDRETCENHASKDAGFHGPYAAIRATRDHAYHGYYSQARQKWQDSILEPVVQRTPEQPLPRLVFTCGAMGVGKGFALGWMSSEGIFPLENIVHIDPDHFKEVMPEWPAYVEHGKQLGNPELPGSLCHRESCYLQEIALEESLRRSQHIWVDGSLRNAQWFVKVFDDIRERFPAYRIAIFEVTAPEHLIRQRIADRAQRTGRSIPQELAQASLEAVERSVLTLMPRADFLVSIDTSLEVPRLRYSATLDRSGDWSALTRRFARALPAPVEFPSALAPIFIARVEGCEVELDGPLQSVFEGHRGGQFVHLTVGGERHRIAASPAFGVTLYGEARNMAKVPNEAVMVAWLYPSEAKGKVHPTNLSQAQESLLRFGGLIFFRVDDAIVGINAMSPQSQAKPPALLQFGPPEHFEAEEAAVLAMTRWAEVTLPHIWEGGGRRFAFLTPHEKLGRRRLGACSGVIYEVADKASSGVRYVFFPTLRALA